MKLSAPFRLLAICLTFLCSCTKMNDRPSNNPYVDNPRLQTDPSVVPAVTIYESNALIGLIGTPGNTIPASDFEVRVGDNPQLAGDKFRFTGDAISYQWDVTNIQAGSYPVTIRQSPGGETPDFTFNITTGNGTPASVKPVAQPVPGTDDVVYSFILNVNQ